MKLSSYTTELRTYIESFSQYQESLSYKEKIEIGRTKLFDFDYPIFDLSYKKVFETHIIRKFYNREIGFETEGLFKFNLETWLNINMPYYNRLFESEMLEYDPLINSEMNVKHTQKNERKQKDLKEVDTDSLNTQKAINDMESEGSYAGKNITSGGANQNTKSDNKADNFERNVKSDTPDGRLRLQTQEGKGVIEYASGIEEDATTIRGTANNTQSSNYHGASNDNSSGKNTSKSNTDVEGKGLINVKDKLDSNVNEIEDFIQSRIGKIGVATYPEMVIKYRNSFLRIENLIHNELQQLFMLVY